MSAPTNIIQRDLDAWDGVGDPPGIETIRQQPEWQTMRPAERMLALNQAQRMAANRIRTDDPAGYGTTIQMVERDFDNARGEELESALAADVASGALTRAQVAAYRTKGTEAVQDEPVNAGGLFEDRQEIGHGMPQQQGGAKNYLKARYGDDTDRAGPWVTQKQSLTGADGKPAGFLYIRHDPRLTGNTINAENDRAEVSYTLNGKDGRVTGVSDVKVAQELDRVTRTKAAVEYGLANQSSGDFSEIPALPYKASEADLGAIESLKTPPAYLPSVLAARSFSAQAQQDPALADKFGQGFWQGLPGQAAKGFLNLGAAAVHAPGALFGSRESVENWQQGQQDIESDIEGQSRLGFKGGTWNSVLKAVSEEALPMAMSMTTSAVGRLVQRGIASSVGKSFISKMAALEMEQAAKQGITGLTKESMAKVIAGELTGEGVGTSARQTLTASLSRGLFGKWLGTAEIEGAMARKLADRVSQAVAFLPSSARSGLQNIATTLDAAEAARAAGDEKKAQELEDNAVMNGWAGLGIETLSENMWVNHMLVTRAGRPLANVAASVLERKLAPGVFNTLKQRAKAAIVSGTKAGAEEGTEEIFAGVGGRAWMNTFAAQNDDLLKGLDVEFLTGAVMGAVLGAGRELAQNGKPAAFNELATRGLAGDDKAMASLSRIMQKAEEQKLSGAPEGGGAVEGTVADAVQGDPASGEAELPHETKPAGNSVTRLPGLVAGTSSPPAAPTGGLEVPSTPPVLATPGTSTDAPIPDNQETVNEQARLAAEKGSTRKAVLITPGTPMPAKTPGLKAFQGETNGHGTVLYNPQKITPAEIRKAVSGNVFDAAVLGFSQPSPATETTQKSSQTITGSNAQTGAEMPVPAFAPGEANIVTANTPAATNVQAELVSNPYKLPEAIAAAQAAVPDGVVEVKTPAQVAAERLTSATPVPSSTNPVAPLNTAGPTAPGASAKAGQSRAGAGRVATPTPAPVRETNEELSRRRKQEARLAKAAKPKGKAWFRPAPRQEGVDEDMLDHVLKNKLQRLPPLPPKNRLDGTRPPRAGIYDKLARFQKRYPPYYAAITRDGGNKIDEVASLKGLSPDELIDAVESAIVSRQKFRDDSRKRAANQKEEERAALRDGTRRAAAWNKATAEGPIKASGLDLAQVGDKIMVDDVPLEVTEVSDTGVLLTDGDKFGEQWVDFEDIIFIDEYTPAEPTERPGNPDADRIDFSRSDDPFRQDFLAGTDDDVFNLVDELPEDRRKREARELKERTAREQREREAAKKKADSQQGTLFSATAPPHSRTTAPSPAQAASALRILRANAPELLTNVTLTTTAELSPDNFHPDDWQSIIDGQSEGFYNPATDQITILTDNISPRKGETAIGAVARVIAHETVAHRGLAALRKSDPNFSQTWKALTDEIPAEELAALLPLYPHLAERPDKLAEEWFARHYAEPQGIAATRSLVARMWAAIKAAVARLFRGFVNTPLEQRARELVAASRAALRTPSTENRAPGTDLMQSRALGPIDARDIPLPQWLKDKAGIQAVTPYQVKALTTRAIIKGDKLPRGWQQVLHKAGHEIAGVQSHMAMLSNDLNAAMKDDAKARGIKPNPGDAAWTQMQRTVQLALSGAPMRMLTHTPTREAAIKIRAFLDTLSEEIATITGGDIGDTIMDNLGEWMRRSYLAFDKDAGWSYDALTAAAAAGKPFHGRDAKRILDRARSWLASEYPTLTPLGIEAKMRLLSDRDTLGGALADSPQVPKDVSSLIKRRVIPKVIRELMGEVKDPLANVTNSVSFQSQFIARHDQQRTLTEMGLAAGMFSTRQEGRFTHEVGGEAGPNNERWGGFYVPDPNPTTGNGRLPIYTTPELAEALAKSSSTKASEVGHALVDGIQWLSGFAKANKVALNPDSIAPQYLGNVSSMISTGVLLWSDGFKNVYEAIRLTGSQRASAPGKLSPVETAIRDTRRRMLTEMTASGITSSLGLRDLEVTLDTAMLKFTEANKAWDKGVGFVHGALLGQSLGGAFGPVGRAVGAVAGAAGGTVVGEKKIKGALHHIAEWAIAKPDRWGKMAVFLTEFQTNLRAGMNREAAWTSATEKTLNTMPSYDKVLGIFRAASKYGFFGSFFAFQHEVVRNTIWNFVYMKQELASGNAALTVRGTRRLLGQSAIFAALGWGINAAVQGIFGAGVDDDKDRAYRRSLAAPWEKTSTLSYTLFDKEKAQFFNASYLMPQSLITEIIRAVKEGDNPATAILDKLDDEFATGSVHLSPMLEILMNAHKGAPDRPITTHKGWQGFYEKAGYYMRAVLEPGAANKLERVVRAIKGDNTSTRTFSLDEEFRRLMGMRSYTYTHEARIKSALYDFRDQRDAIRQEAGMRWNQANANHPQIIAEANARLQKLADDHTQFQADMKTLGLTTKAKTVNADSNINFRPDYRLQAGKTKPEAVAR